MCDECDAGEFTIIDQVQTLERQVANRHVDNKMAAKVRLKDIVSSHALDFKYTLKCLCHSKELIARCSSYCAALIDIDWLPTFIHYLISVDGLYPSDVACSCTTFHLTQCLRVLRDVAAYSGRAQRERALVRESTTYQDYNSLWG